LDLGFKFFHCPEITSVIANAAFHSSLPTPFGPKAMVFNSTTKEIIKTYFFPADQVYAKLQLNDIRIKNTLGYAFLTEDSLYGSIITLELASGQFIRHLYNTTFTKPDTNFVSFYDGEPIRNWNGTTPSYMTSGTNGLELSNDYVYLSVKSSHRRYWLSRSALVSNLPTEELGKQVQEGSVPTETAGYTADDNGRIYIMASEVRCSLLNGPKILTNMSPQQNAIMYFDTRVSEADYVTGNELAADGLVPKDNVILKTLVRSGLVQAADTAAILDGWLYFDTNQQGYSPLRQYKNVDKRVGPFRSYRYWIGRGPAV
jgi:hypothetical protein